MGNFCHKSTKTTLHEVFLRFSDSSKPSQSVLLIYKMALLAEIRKSDENLLKACKVASVTKVQNNKCIFWWRHDNRKQSTSARELWCDVSCDVSYCPVNSRNQRTRVSYDAIKPTWASCFSTELSYVKKTVRFQIYVHVGGKTNFRIKS